MKETNLTRLHSLASIRGWVKPGTAGSDDGSGGGGSVVGTDYENASGSDLVAGDVVVVNSSGQIETTTTAQDTRPVGVLVDDIDDGDFGAVAFGGPVDLINVTSSVTAGNYAETSAVAGEATENGTRRAGSFGYFTSSGTTPSAYLFGGGPDPAAADPADDNAVWLPLTTTVGGDDVLVFDADHSLIPTLVPF